MDKVSLVRRRRPRGQASHETVHSDAVPFSMKAGSSIASDVRRPSVTGAHAMSHAGDSLVREYSLPSVGRSQEGPPIRHHKQHIVPGSKNSMSSPYVSDDIDISLPAPAPAPSRTPSDGEGETATSSPIPTPTDIPVQVVIPQPRREVYATVCVDGSPVLETDREDAGVLHRLAEGTVLLVCPALPSSGKRFHEVILVNAITGEVSSAFVPTHTDKGVATLSRFRIIPF